MMKAGWICVITMTLSGLSGCGKVEPTHPLDPETPIDFQRTSSVSGRVIVPTGADPTAVSSVTVHLDPVTADLVSRRGSVDEEGFFEVEDVIPGSYRMTAWGPGLSGGPVVVNVLTGSKLELGSIPLVPVLGQVRGWVFSTTGKPATGAVVSADDGYEVTVVDTEGRFTLRVLEGDRVLNVALPQHAPFLSKTLSVEAWNEVNLEAPVFLTPYAGRVVGQIALRQHSTPARENKIKLVLSPVKADVDERTSAGENTADTAGSSDDAGDNTVADGNAPAVDRDGRPNPSFFRDDRSERTDFDVDEDGSFTMIGVEPGEYILHARALGYDDQKRPLFVAADQAVNIGRLELSHSSTGSRSVRLDGQILTGGVGLVAIGVDVFIVSLDGDPLLSYARVITDSNGDFYVPASSDEQYWLRAEVAGFPDIDSGPYRYFPGQGFINPSGDPPNFTFGGTR